ncbi:MAG: hypothetical protein ACK5GJ_13350 [Planctomycetota bacterium]
MSVARDVDALPSTDRFKGDFSGDPLREFGQKQGHALNQPIGQS